MPSDPRPTGAQIRRALAECMTLGDIDDAMGWEPGTARRRRWRDQEGDGLPFSDVEIGGVALWFRSTIEAWEEQSGEAEGEVAESDEDLEEGDDEAEEEAQEEPAAEEVPVLVSGYELEPGQRVLVDVRGRWREAHVRHRDRATVAVDYTLDGTPSGLRRQRVGLDRIRVPD